MKDHGIRTFGNTSACRWCQQNAIASENPVTVGLGNKGKVEVVDEKGQAGFLSGFALQIIPQVALAPYDYDGSNPALQFGDLFKVSALRTDNGQAAAYVLTRAGFNLNHIFLLPNTTPEHLAQVEKFMQTPEQKR